MNSKKGKTLWVIFLCVGLLLQCLDSSSRMSQPASYYHTIVSDNWCPPVGAVFPQSPLLHAHVSAPAEFPSLSRPHVECSHHLNAHLSAFCCEPSHRLLVPCSIASMLSAALLLPVAAPGARRQSLAQPAPLAELTWPKACHLGPCLALPTRGCAPLSSSASDASIRTKFPPHPRVPFTVPVAAAPPHRVSARPPCRSAVALSHHLPLQARIAPRGAQL
jgi:hypothetical protein